MIRAGDEQVSRLHHPGTNELLFLALREAVTESRLAYEFNATSYTISAMSACIAAERALGVLREALDAEAEP
jgi:hypothetical protein